MLDGTLFREFLFSTVVSDTIKNFCQMVRAIFVTVTLTVTTIVTLFVTLTVPRYDSHN
jgi:hypothetical protein